jgi:hypothetical protein
MFTWEDGQWLLQTISHASLVSIMGSLTDEWRKTRARHDFTLTTRTLAELDAAPVALTPEDLAKVPDASVHIFLFEGLGGALSDMMTSVWKPPGSNQLSSAGVRSRFRESMLPETLMLHLGQQNFRSYEPAHPGDPPGIFRPDYHRETLIRMSSQWNARSLVPEAFPGPTPEQQRAKQDAIQAEYEELKKLRDPMERRRRLQAQQAEEHEMLKLGRWIVRTEHSLQANEELPAPLRNEDTIAQLKRELEDFKRQLHELKQRSKALGGLTPVAPAQPSPPRNIEQPTMHAVAGGGWTIDDTPQP